MFYTKEVKLYEYKRVVDEWGIIGEGKYLYVKSIPVDIQPYSKEKLDRDYGYALNTTKRMFADLDSSIKESTLITYRGKPFDIVKITEWDDYLDIALDDSKEVVIDG